MSRLRPYLQLVRLPAVFTALADILLGAFALGAYGLQWLTVALLGMTSACLYMSGMVWNDYFDQAQDKRERPSRPIPSGRVSPAAAARLACALMAAGLTFSIAAGASIPFANPDSGYSFSWTPPDLAGYLVVTIFLYDRWLKRTWAGPIGMGLCRFLNVLLGLSAIGPGESRWSLRLDLPPWSYHLAAVVGLYIVGVTWFARREAGVSKKNSLIGAGLTMLASAPLALMLRARLESDEAFQVRLALTDSSWLFPYLLVALLFFVGFPVCRAIANPSPSTIQGAIKRCLQGLIVFDAVLASTWVGWLGLVILLLLVPIHFLNRWRWLYMT